MKKYLPYKPTKWEQRIDKAFGLLSPRSALNRMVARERTNWFRYLAAQPTTARKNSPSTSAGEWLKIQREKLQVMWNAINMVSNSGLCTGILTKFPTYVCGTLGWQARTGDKTVNEMYQNYIKAKTSKPANIDITRRHTLRQMCMMDIKCIALKGDIGTNIVRGDDGELYLQGIEADRIGDPYRWDTSDRYVRGLVLDRVGGIEAVKVYHQDRRSGTYKYDNTFPTRDPNGLPNFLFFNNPIDYDNYRGLSLFQHAIDNSTYIDRMRQYELQALLWASSQSGVYYTKSGGLPEALPFSRTPVTDKDGNIIDTYETRPNTISALSADGEKVEMFQHDRPSPNVIGMYENTVRDIAIGAGLTYGFCYDMTGLTGPAVRQCSAQDARAIMVWQMMLKEQKLDPVIMLLLGTAIANGELPYIDTWMLWDWFFPPKPTIDVGRESEANIEEINSCINTGASVVADAGLGDVQEVITQRGHEVEMQIEAAMEVAQRLGLDWKEVHAFMIPPPRGGGKGGAMAAAQGAANLLKSGMNGDREGASDDGVSLDEEGSGKRFSQNGHREGPVVIQNFYREDQARDDSGKWTDEGRGSQQPGYVSPSEQGASAGGGKASEAPGPARADTLPKSNYGDAATRAKQSSYFEDAEKYRALKAQWATVNRSLLDQIDTPDSPQAKALLQQQFSIVKQMHTLKADPGGIEGIGLPGGPRDVLVIGAGPGGMSSAIMGATDGLDTMFVDKNVVPGGQAKYSSRVENFPGFPIGVSGKQLAQNMYDQATRLGAESKMGVGVTGMEYDPKSGLKHITFSDGSEESARSVILGGGVEFRKLSYPGFDTPAVIYADGERLTNEGAGKPVVVIGGSNGAAQAALGAARKADHVYILVRHSIGDQMSDYQVEALRANPEKITILENDEATKLDVDPQGNGKTLHTKNGKDLPAHKVGVFVGSNPATGWLPPEMGRVQAGRDKGRLMVNDDLEVVNDKGAVSVPGVFAVGDIRQNTIQRIGGAVGDGQHAARNVFNYFAKTLGVKEPGKMRDVSVEAARSGKVAE